MGRTAVVTVYIAYTSDEDDASVVGVIDKIDKLPGVIETDFVDSYED